MLEEGWEPDLEEFVRRVPDEYREEVFQEVDRICESRSYEVPQEPELAEPEAPRVVHTGEEAFAPRAWGELERAISEVSEGLDVDVDLVHADESEIAEEIEEIQQLSLSDEVEPIEELFDSEDPYEHEIPHELGETTELPPESADRPDLDATRELHPESPLDQQALPEIPGYRMDREIGCGPRGITYSGFDKSRQKRVTVKMLHTPAEQVLLQKALKASRLASAGIIPVEAITEDGALVADFVDGQPVDEACQALSIPDRTAVLASLARSLQAAHDAGYIHRALKPENILVTEALEPKVLDIGLPISAKLERASLFASPEQVRGGSPRASTDIFSLGSIIYLALTGRVPFHQVEDIGEIDPPLPRDVQADLPPDLQAICMACLARNPRARPEAAQVAVNLERFLAGKAILLRPVLYLNRLRRQVKTHVGEVREWARLGVLSEVESDRLQTFYRKKVEAEEGWRFDAHRLPGAQILMLAGSLLLVAATFLSFFYAPAGALWLLPPIVCAALLSAGIWARLRRDWQPATSFLFGGVLAAAPATLSVLGQVTTWSEPVRLLAASGVPLLISCAAWIWLEAALFAWATAFLGASAYVAGMFVLGLAGRPHWLQAVWLSPLVSLAALGVLFENRRRHRWSLPFYVVGLAALLTLPFLAAMGKALPARALPSWIDGLHAVAALHGLVLLAVGAALGRTRSLDLRWIARVLSVAAPVVLTGALLRNALLSGHPAAVASCGCAGLFFLALATWRKRRVDLLAGLSGLALCSYLAFALQLVAPGILAPALAVAGLALALGTYVRVRA
jgi:hypothetical protein